MTKEAIQTESSALAHEIRKKKEKGRSSRVFSESEVWQLPSNLAQGSERSVVMSKKLTLCEAEMQNTTKDFESQIHQLLVPLRHKDVTAMFVGQFEQVKDGQELGAAEAKHSKSKNKVQKNVDHKFKFDAGFALGLPISVLNLISEGIMSFNKEMSESCFQFQIINIL
jgi:hypothetical protein